MAKVLNDLVLRISADTAQLQKGVDQTKKKLGGFQKAMSGIGGAIAGAFAIGALIQFAQEIGKTALEFNKISRSISQFADISDTALGNATAQVKGLADVFNESSDEIVKAANTMAKELEITFLSALNLVEQGLVKGANANGEFLDGVKEYSTFMNDAGISAGRFIGILKAQSDLGIFGDKGIDTIKEGTVRLREMTKATAEAIDGLGLSSDAIQKGIEDGTLSIEKALQIISLEIMKLPATSNEVGTAIADILGGAGEDAGLRWVEAMAKGFQDITQIAKNAAQQQTQDYLDSVKIVNEAWVLWGIQGGEVWLKVKTIGNLVIAGFINGIKGFADYFKEIGDGIKTFWLEILALALKASGLAPGDNTGTPSDPNAFPISEESKKFLDSGTEEETKGTEELANAKEKATTNTKKLTDAQIALNKAYAEAVATRKQNLELFNSAPSTAKTSLEIAPMTDIFKESADPTVGVDVLKAKFAGLGDYIADQLKSGEIALDELTAKMAVTREELQGKLTGAVTNIGNSFLQLQQSLSGINWSENALEGMAAIAAGATAIIPQIVTAIAALMGLAAAENVAGAAKLGFPAGLIAGVAAVGTIIGLTAAIYGLVSGSKKAIGGLVGGSPGFTMVGEQGPELLQIGQPGRVYSASQTNNLLGGNNGGDVRFRIEGDALVGVLGKTTTKNNIFG